MSPLFKKLNLGTQQVIHAVNAPASFEPKLAALKTVVVHRSATGKVAFAIAFVVTQAELDALGSKLAAAAEGDAILWMAYPKSTSKRYKCEFNRDSGWGVLGRAGFEPVRQVAIDADWSALRFRRVDYIKTITRSQMMAISEPGKRRARKVDP